MVDFKKDILKEINQSNDKGTENTEKISFSDVIDLTFYYLSLQSDIKDIGKITTSDFYYLLKNNCFSYAKKDKNFCLLKTAWTEDNLKKKTSEEANIYMSHFPGIITFYNLRIFYYYPKRTGHGWEAYRDNHIKNHVFPKWKYNIDKIDSVLDFAEELCKEIRKNNAATV